MRAHILVDYSGQKIHKLTYIEPTDKRKNNHVVWKAVCECGLEIEVTPSDQKYSCGCVRRPYPSNTTKSTRLDIPVGTRFGQLIVLNQNFSIATNSIKRPFERAALCFCDCGVEKIIRIASLQSGKTRSCGCYVSPEGIIRRKEWAVKNRKRPAHITTAMQVWKGRYDDGCSFEKFFELSQLDCFYCGEPPSNVSNPYARPSQKKGKGHYSQEWIDQAWFKYNGLDRIDSTKPHLEDNIVPSCKVCNWAKSNMTQSEFYDWIKRVHSRMPNPLPHPL